MMRTPGLHFSIVASDTRLAVSGVNGVCTVMKSHFAQMSSRSPRSIPTSRSCSLVITGSYPITCMPMVCAMPATT